MQIDLSKGKTGTVELEDGTIITFVGGITVRAERNGETLYKCKIEVSDFFPEVFVAPASIKEGSCLTLKNGLFIGIAQQDE